MPEPQSDPIVVIGQALRLPGGVDDVDAFERMLFEGRSVFASLPEDRFDRSLYFDHRRGQVGKSYTDLGGCVSATALDGELESRIRSLGCFDLTHRQFAQVACRAWSVVAGAAPDLARRCGVYVGHSGGTDQGGPLTMSTLAETAVEQVEALQSFSSLGPSVQQQVIANVISGIRGTRPRRTDDSIHFNAYSAASLVARLLSLGGPREVIDAACASSLLALSHAVSAIERGRIDAAIVGGATYNNVDNLILFSQSQACSDRGCSPFDERASGLISSEGYVAIVVTRQSLAAQHRLPLLGVIRGVGVSSDGRGKSLWAPRTEGQQLAIRRGYAADAPLQIDYLEAHATSTRVGDATELQSLGEILRDRRAGRPHGSTASEQRGGGSDQEMKPLWVGSVKSNLGHTLEAAGLVGLVKLLIALRRGQIPPTIHFQQPTPEFDWSAGRIRVVSQCAPWPASGRPRRGAVNAFGIGGLNGHVVIEAAPPQAARVEGAGRLRRQPEADEPIAIVGRGVVLPGAFDVPAFARLLASGGSAIGPPAEERWRGSLGQDDSLHALQVATNRGGYIKDYRFDGQRYRIPPKQVQLANPLQMMLIDAVQQAVGEAADGQWVGDRQRTAVVIGTIFGGEFSNQLQVGLRLPEICQRLLAEMRRTGVQEKTASQIVAEYRRLMLARHPALLDETGSFTASTLASRIAKSFDLMGGACAVDADDASGSLALMLAADQLRCSAVDTVLCGVAQRSLDLVGFHDLQLRGRLACSGQPEEIPADCSRILPGEGVAVVLLRRLSDARRDRMPILGLIDEFAFGTQDDAAGWRHQRLGEAAINRKIARRIGYLAGAHAMIRLIAETIQWESGPASDAAITAVAEDGFYITASARHRDAELRQPLGVIKSEPMAQAIAVKAPVEAEASPKAGGLVAPEVVSSITQPAPIRIGSASAGRCSNADRSTPDTAPRLSTPDTAPRMMNSTDPGSFPALRLEGVDDAEFEQTLRRAAQSPGEAFNHRPVAFSPRARFCAAVVATSADSYAAAIQDLLSAWQAGRRSLVLDRQAAMLWDRGRGNDRIAWAFPGQGSQYSAVPQVVSEEPAARAYLHRFDTLLAELGLAAIGDNLADSQQQLGHDVWWTQLWVLAVSATLADSLTSDGHRPDLVLGHSFGECGAALQAGVMSLTQAILFAKHRSDAVVMTSRQRGQLLSIRATPSRVEAILAALNTDISITHHNAPEQTVVAGLAKDIAAVRAALNQASIASVVISVPAAFHSPAMEAARRALQTAFAEERLRPPRCGFFSTLQGRYLAEPSQIRDSLIDQLTSPLLYSSAIQRAVRDGCGLFIEVGPSDVLTRLHRATVGSNALCLSLDSGQHSHQHRLAVVRLACECVAGPSSALPDGVSACAVATDTATSHHARAEHASAGHSKPNGAAATGLEAPLRIVDVTRRGRARIDAPRPDAPLTGALPRSNDAPIRPTTAHAPPPAVAMPFAGDGGVADENRSASAPLEHGDSAERFLVDLVVELTGYSPEVIDFEADLEAELGVDSIKKAQLVGELAEWASLQLDLRQLKLADFHSLADIRRLITQSPDHRVTAAGGSGERGSGKRGGEAQGGEAYGGEPHRDEPFGTRAAQRSHADCATQPAASCGAAEHGLSGAIESLMIDFIVDSTGYSPDVIDMDADLEGELGLDSIKKAQLLGELASHYELHQVDLRRLRLADFPTLGSIRRFVVEHLRPVTPDEGPGSAEAVPQLAHSPARAPVASEAEQTGVKKKMIRRALRALVDAPSEAAQGALVSLLDDDRLRQIREQGPAGAAIATVANEAGVLPASLWRWLAEDERPGTAVARWNQDAGQPRHGDGVRDDAAAVERNEADALLASTEALDPPQPIPRRGTCRFGLRMVELPRQPAMPTEPRLSGAALILGHNAIADAIAARLQRRGITAHRLAAASGPDQLEAELTRLWAAAETPHLFLTTPHDTDALQTLSPSQWQRRRNDAVMIPFRVCQLWMQRMIDCGSMDQASLVAVLNLGGDFGFSASRVPACESGGLAGLTKAMMIEAWTRGFRQTPMKVIDIAAETSAEQAVEGIFRELAVPSHDEEVSVDGAARWVVWPEYRPLENPAEATGDRTSRCDATPTPGGTWIVSGGGRGITALTSLALAEKYSLVLHLLGTAPAPDLSEATRRQAKSDRAALRRQTMHQAQQSGANPIETWRDLEKAIEIDLTLSDCRRRGIRATYHCVDVADSRAVNAVLARIRLADGPIRGVIHGAGAGQDARFDRKRLDKVEKCIRAKVDGCIALAAATRDDPLQWFVGFGSISGRFGANGHTDYSLANDMLAKTIDCLKQQRPAVRCVTFHWHAWGDLGMATKPEAKLALEMIGMEFMPAQQGLEHFLAEFESGGDQSEVLITDRSYIRKFFPSFRHDVTAPIRLPLLDPNGTKQARLTPGSEQRWVVTIDPQDDRFLSEHRVGGRPTLPFVIALEMIAEAAKYDSGSERFALSDVEAVHPLKFIDDDCMAVEIVPEAGCDRPDSWCLRADLRRRDGRLVEAGRIHFRATACGTPAAAMPARLTQRIDLDAWDFRPVEYLSRDAPIYHGEPFQMLRSIATTQTEAVGKILTPSPVHLGEEKRPVLGWVIPCAVMDAMLYAAAVLGWQLSGRASLPVRFDKIHLGRSPEPGEALVVHVRVGGQDETGMSLMADLIGLNGDHLLALRGYRIGWLR